MSLEDDVGMIARELQAAAAMVLDRSGVKQRSQTEVAHELGLELNLVSRVFRGVSAEDPLDSLQIFPGPQGLTIFCDAVTQVHGEAQGATKQLSSAVGRYESYADAFPGGRTALVTVASGWSEQTRVRAARTASQSAFRGMSQLLECRASAVGVSSVFTPMSDGRVQEISLITIEGFQRFQSRSHLPVYECPSLAGAPLVGEEIASRELALCRTDGQKAFLPLMLRGFEDAKSLPEVAVSPDTGVGKLLIPSEVPGIGERLSFTVACCQPHETLSQAGMHMVPVVTSVPARTVVRDVHIHRDLPGARTFDRTFAELASCAWSPEVVAGRQRTGPGITQLTVDHEIQHFPTSRPRTEHRALPGTGGALAKVFDAAGLDRDAYQATRLVAPYFPIGVRLTLLREIDGA